MMKQARFYAIKGDDGDPRVMHAIIGCQPEDAVEITPEEAGVIAAAVRAKEPNVSAAPAPVQATVSLEAFEAVAVELEHLKIRFDTLARAIAEGAPK